MVGKLLLAPHWGNLTWMNTSSEAPAPNHRIFKRGNGQSHLDVLFFSRNPPGLMTPARVITYFLPRIFHDIPRMNPIYSDIFIMIPWWCHRVIHGQTWHSPCLHYLPRIYAILVVLSWHWVDIDTMITKRSLFIHFLCFVVSWDVHVLKNSKLST